MNVKTAKKTLHELIDQIEDNELLNIYIKLLEREVKKNNYKNFFNTNDQDLISRAKSSLRSIEENKTRSIDNFKKDVEDWKKQRNI